MELRSIPESLGSARHAEKPLGSARYTRAMPEHPLRRRYGLELGLGLALAGLAAWFVIGGEQRLPDAPPAAVPARAPAAEPAAGAPLVPAHEPASARDATSPAPEPLPADEGPALEVLLRGADGQACPGARLELALLYLENGALKSDALGQGTTGATGGARFRLDAAPFRERVASHLVTLHEPFFPRVARELGPRLPGETVELRLPPHGSLEVRVARPDGTPAPAFVARLLCDPQASAEDARASFEATDPQPIVTRTGSAGAVLFPYVGVGFGGWLVIDEPELGPGVPARVLGPAAAGERATHEVRLRARAVPGTPR